MDSTQKNEAGPIRGRPRGALDKRPRTKQNLYNNMNPGDSTAITEHNVALMRLPPIDLDDRKQIEERIRLYFDLCISHDMRPGAAGVCLALGISRQTWYAWGAGTRRNGDYSDIVSKTRQGLEAVLEQYMLSGKINPVSGIFLLKNCYGYQDKSEIVIGPSNPLGNCQTMEQLKQKYKDQVYNLVDETEDDYNERRIQSSHAKDEETHSSLKSK